MEELKEIRKLIRDLSDKVEYLGLPRFIPRYISLRQAAKVYDVSKNYFYVLRREGKVTIYYLGRKPYINTNEVDLLINPNDETINK